MIDDKTILDKYNIKPIGYKKIKKAVLITTKDNNYILKSRIRNKEELFNYLRSRSFDYFPVIYNESENDSYDIYKYYDNYTISNEERASDLIKLISLLHAKTTHYRKIDVDDIKTIYEELDKKLKYLTYYYTDIFELIDSEIYMSPSSYLLARNITKINSLLNFCSNELDSWYELVKNKKKERVSMIHNNLELNHLIRNENSYLISWDYSKIDMPIFDLYNFYKKNYMDVEFDELLLNYEKRYPLLEDERKLLFILISMPEKIDFVSDEYENTKKVNDLLFYIYKTDKIISPYYSNE